MNKIPEKILQTSENTWYLFPSTDKTAIYSFIVAAIVGLVLALIGMYLAWWYGKKSFDLTTKSFEITVQQIIASIDAAKNNTEKNSQMNLDLIQSQKDIQLKELNFKYMHDWVQNFDNLSSEFLGQVYSYVMFVNTYARRHEFALENIEKQWENFSQGFEEISLQLQRVSILKFKLFLLLNEKSDLENQILDDLNFLDDWLRSEYIENCLENKKFIDFDDENYLHFSNRIKQCKNNMSEFRLLKTSQQLDSI
ncbi:hypothetical protein [Acinetobacter bereziniae]|uniref:hypothetical protein n=1 Tax=Acinetobacter bereziniae TaxID=106648 RepID=UPI00073E6D83|nr:hypothetical protein [Acinetobacter bereziniae]RSZ25735.1 hypothetical protein NDM229_006755 [Acinetobacter bereziniae]